MATTTQTQTVELQNLPSTQPDVTIEHAYNSPIGAPIGKRLGSISPPPYSTAPVADPSTSAAAGTAASAIPADTSGVLDQPGGDGVAPPGAAVQLERWNYPRINLWRTLAVFYCFFTFGANDAAYGALLPYIESYYEINYTVVSLIFLLPFVGYTVAALICNALHERFGQRGIAFMGPLFRLIPYVIISNHPPFPVVALSYLVIGFGNGLVDSAWNAYIGMMADTNEVLGFMHGLYGLGAAVGPIIATSLVTQAGAGWWSFYWVMIGLVTLDLIFSVSAFWEATGEKYRAIHKKEASGGSNTLKEALLTWPNARIVWLCAVFLLIYVGIEVALGGWIVVFMRDVRGASQFASGLTATGFWLGLTVGRFVLGFVTPRIGEKLAISIYLPIAMALELLFWLVPQFFVSAVAVALQGFFLGPLFPAAIVVEAKMLPRRIHVTAIGFASAFGGSGGAIFPFVVGAIAQAAGVTVLQPIILALLACLLASWLALPRVKDRREE